MKYTEYIPTGQLSEYIDKFWHCQSDAFNNTTLNIPLLHHELVLNFSDFHYVKHGASGNKHLVNPRAWISGLQTSSCLSESKGRHEMLGVLFKPDGLSSFIRFSSSDFTDQFVDATLIFDRSFQDLLEGLLGVHCPFSKIHHVERYLSGKLLNHCALPKYLKPSMTLLADVNKRVRINEISKRISVTHKSLISCYHKHVGLSPVKYWQLLAVSMALSHLAEEPGRSLTQLALQLNFYDQSHFTHVFQSITGLTPSHYVGQVLLNKVDSLAPNYISVAG